MRISDWSSDVCSSDLATYKGKEFKRLDNALSAQTAACTLINLRLEIENLASGLSLYGYARNLTDERYSIGIAGPSRLIGTPRTFGIGVRAAWSSQATGRKQVRSEERRVGKECVST